MNPLLPYASTPAQTLNTRGLALALLLVVLGLRIVKDVLMGSPRPSVRWLGAAFGAVTTPLSLLFLGLVTYLLASL